MPDMFQQVLDKLNDNNYKHYAAKAEVEPSLVYKWMNGYVTSPRYSTLKKVYDAIFGGKDGNEQQCKSEE